MAKSADAFRTISEVADWLELPPHVLRFWESKFSQVKPVKRAGGRRYYRPNDMALLAGIKHLLHVEGMTIKAVQQKLRTDGIKSVSALSPPLEGADAIDDAPLVDVTPPSDATAEQPLDDAPVLLDADVDEFSPLPEETVVSFPSAASAASDDNAAADEDVKDTAQAVDTENFPQQIDDAPIETETDAVQPVDVILEDEAVTSEPQQMDDADTVELDERIESEPADPEAPDAATFAAAPPSQPLDVAAPTDETVDAAQHVDAVPDDAPTTFATAPEETFEDAEAQSELPAEQPLPTFLRQSLSDDVAEDTPAENDPLPSASEPPAPKVAEVTVAPDPEDFALVAKATSLSLIKAVPQHDLRRLSPRLAPIHKRLRALADAMDVQG